ncbi:MAG: MBL fold metallo-hydrolase [Planktomarina sp.]
MQTTKRNFLKSALAAPALIAPATFMASSAPAVAAPAPGYYKYKVGDITVTALLDGYMGIPEGFVLGFDETKARAATAKAYRTYTPGMVQIPVNGYVIDTGSKVILMDAGASTMIDPSMGGLPANLQAAGYKTGDIDTVLFTHLHPDHVGAMLNAQGGKTFENASIACSEIEWGFIHDDNIRNAAPKEFQGMIDMIRGFVAPYASALETFSGEKELFTGITSMPLPGHTPGHTGYTIHSGNDSLLIWGDIIHFSTLQFAHPDWGVAFDTDPAMAAQSRVKMFDRASADGMAVAGMHIDFPGIGYVERSGGTYRHVNAPWQPASENAGGFQILKL